MSTRLNSAILLMFNLGCWLPVWGADYFVDPQHPAADDSSRGGESAPWKTLSQACSAVRPGDTVYVKTGVYVDDRSPETRQFRPVRSGTPEDPIRFVSVPPRAAVIRSRSLPQSADSYAWGLGRGVEYVVIDGFRIEGGIVLGYDGCRHCTVRNCEITHGRCPITDRSLNWGLTLHGDVQECTIENNYVHDLIDSGNRAHNTACIMMFGGGRKNRIRQNTADGGRGIVYSAFGQKGGRMRDNVWSLNLARHATAGFLGMASTNDQHASQDNLYRQNVIVDCRTAFELSHMCYRFKIAGNTAVGCDAFLDASAATNRETQLWNNIHLANEGRAMRWGGYPEAQPFSVLLKYSDYNCFFNTAMIGFREKTPTLRYPSLAAWQQETGFDRHSIAQDPRLVDPDHGDFRLREDSPCRRAGLDRLAAEEGRTPSKTVPMGAYETGDEIIGHRWSPAR